jgi:hypothetical protein
MTAQDFVAKMPAKAKPDSAKTAAIRQLKGIILQASPTFDPNPESLTPHSFVILRPGNPDYTARDTMAARFMPPSGALKDKCIQTH